MLELAKKRYHKGNVALHLIIVKAVLKITETDLDFALFLHFSDSSFVYISVPGRGIHFSLSPNLSPSKD